MLVRGGVQVGRRFTVSQQMGACSARNIYDWLITGERLVFDGDTKQFSLG
jgi:hypothetical protein